MANIRHNLIIKASIEQVYDAITSEEGLKGWWTEGATAKPVEGYVNHFRFGEEYFNRMEIIKLTAPTTITWKCVDGEKEWIDTELSFELSKRDEDILLKFSHLNWAEESDFYGLCNHHWGRYLDSLKLLCETGLGKPFTS